MFSKIVSFATFASLALAQSATMSAASPSGSVAVHVIKAMNSAEGKPVFEPASVQAAVGDLIQFQFYPMNHSVVQASFADPCIPLEQSAAANGATGFFSGFMPVNPSSNVMPTFTFAVNDTKPIWFYCSQGKHCQAGMVGVINETPAKPLSDFTARAAQAAANVSPGQSSSGSAAPSNGSSGGYGYPTGSTPTTMQTAMTSGSATSTATNAIATGAAPRNVAGSTASLVFGALAATFFLL